jgi:hypothetical protein
MKCDGAETLDDLADLARIAVTSFARRNTLCYHWCGS